MATQPFNTNPLFGIKQNVSREQKLSYGLAGQFDAVFLSKKQHYMNRQTPIKTKLIQTQTYDAEPLNRTILRFGDMCTVNYGPGEVQADLVASEWHCALPRLFRTDGAFAALNGGEGSNPADLTYTTIAGSDPSHYLEWAPFVGELIFGGLTERLYFKHSAEQTRRYTPFEVHFKRQLFHDSTTSHARDTYLNGVAALTKNTNVAVNLIVPVWQPWSPDNNFSYRHHVPAHVFGEPFIQQFRIPQLAELIRSNVPINVISAGSIARPDFFLRNHYMVRQQEDRAGTANETLDGQQIAYMTSHTITEQEVEVAASNVNVDVNIVLSIGKLPAVVSFVTAHYKDDLQPAGTVATAADVDTDPMTKRTYNNGSEIIGRPNWLATIPIEKWVLMDGPDLVEEERSMGWWINSNNGFVRYFPNSRPTTAMAVFPHCPFPTLSEDNGYGHMDFSTFKNPRLRVTLPANNTKNPSQIRVVRAYHLTKNTIHVKNGTMTPSLHVGS